MNDQNLDDNKYQDRINQKMVKNKISKIREDLSSRNLDERKINILSSGINTKEEAFNRQKKLRRINNDKSARRITKDVSSDLIESEYKRIFNNNDN